jgi:ribosomal protein S8
LEKIHHLLNAIITAAISKRKFAYAYNNKISNTVLNIFLKEGFILGYTYEHNYYKIELNQKFPYRLLHSPYKGGNKQYFSRFKLAKYYGWAIVSSSKGIHIWPHKTGSGIVVCGIKSHIL